MRAKRLAETDLVDDERLAQADRDTTAKGERACFSQGRFMTQSEQHSSWVIWTRSLRACWPQ